MMEQLEQALTAWRCSRSAGLGGLIAVLYDGVPAPVVAPSTQPALFHRKWCEAAVRGPTSARLTAYLARTLSHALDRWDHHHMRERVAAMASRPPNPLVADAALAYALAEHGDFSLYHPALELLATHGDVRHLSALDALVDAHRGSLDPDRQRSELDIQSVYSRLAVKLQGRPPDDASRRKQIDRNLDSPTAVLIRRLFTDIYRNPADPDPRALLRDVLLESDDPRGEFIALQSRPVLNAEARARMHGLHETHRNAWLGPYLSVALRSVAFRRGVPVSATLTAAVNDPDIMTRALHDPRISTIEDLYQGSASELVWRHIVSTKNHLWPQPDPTAVAEAERRLAAVLRAPTDGRLRVGLERCLLAAGSRRGEHMQLDAGPNRSLAELERARALERELGTEWIGPDLCRIFRSVLFEDGFVARATLVADTDAEPECWHRALADPQIGTIHTLHRGRASANRYARVARAIAARRLGVPPGQG